MRKLCKYIAVSFCSLGVCSGSLAAGADIVVNKNLYVHTNVPSLVQLDYRPEKFDSINNDKVKVEPITSIYSEGYSLLILPKKNWESYSFEVKTEKAVYRFNLVSDTDQDSVQSLKSDHSNGDELPTVFDNKNMDNDMFEFEMDLPPVVDKSQNTYSES